MNEDDYAEFTVLVDATIVVDRIDLDDSDNDLIYTDIDAKDLAIHNKYSLNVARIVIERGRQSAFEGFSRIFKNFPKCSKPRLITLMRTSVLKQNLAI